MRFLLLITLSLATSLDSLGVGVAFGLAGTRIRFVAHAIIGAVMLAITVAGVALGNDLTAYLPEEASRWLSAILFAGVGIGMLAPVLKGFRTSRYAESFDDAATPQAAGGGQVRRREAFALGFVLSINNVGGGISAGLIHLSPLEMGALSVLFNILCLGIGHRAGACLRRTPIRSWAQGVAGIALVAIGVYQLC
jgi:putative sporulation protein YtaF